MLHVQIREARIAHGLNQSELARRAGIPRTTLRDFENGENITIETLIKILAQLPNLTQITLGAVQARTTGVDLHEIRDAVARWLEDGRGILALVESAMAQPQPAGGGGGATLHEGGLPISPELEARLARLEEKVGGRKKKEA